MTSKWPGRLFRRSRNPEPDRGAQAALTAAFLDMDKRQTIVEAGVQASDQLFPERRLRQLWEPIAELCYRASGAYLAAAERLQSQTAQRPPQSELELTIRQLADASYTVDQFYNAHREQLDGATSTLAAVPAVAAQARAAADAVRRKHDEGGAAFATYPSVQSRLKALDEALDALVAAEAAGRANATREAAARVRASVTALDEALAAAPSREQDAQRALASVRTRIAAVRTRAERVAPTFSILLREFNAASSTDLAGNDTASKREIAAADAELTQATTALRTGNPDLALELATSVRAHLSTAEQHVDAVTDRLALLREVRDNPIAKESEVRFRLRDAQMLAVSRGLAPEWASVLDAQLDRIDRISGALHGRHPDYWAYVTGLETVKTFISGVVQKMKKQTGSH